MPLQDSARKRLERERLAIEKEHAGNSDPEVTARNVDDSMQHWVGRIKGPADSPYQHGIFFIEMVMPDEYPFVPPKARFDTPIWHPNISSKTGAICIDTLKQAWSPALTVITVLISIRALLTSEEPDDPQDHEVAAMYKRDKEEFDEKARSWVKEHASCTVWPFERKVKSLVDMGVPALKAEEVLKRHGWNLDSAVEECIFDE